MWQDIQAIIGYKPNHTSTPSSEASLPDELNQFYGCFGRHNKVKAIKTVLTADHQPLTHCPTSMRVALSRVNARKAAGLDGIPRHVCSACAVQLTEGWTDIFNLSLP